MQIEQISIFLENKSGRLEEVTAVLRDADINIRALALADTSDFGVLRLLVNDTAKTQNVLKEKGFTISKTEVAAVEVKDQPGGLHSILSVLQKGGVNVEYMYAFIQQSDGNAIMIFRFDDLETAVNLLRENNINVIDSIKLYAL